MMIFHREAKNTKKKTLSKGDIAAIKKLYFDDEEDGHFEQETSNLKVLKKKNSLKKESPQGKDLVKPKALKGLLQK